MTAVTQPAFGSEFGDDLEFDSEVVSETQTREVTLRLHYGLAPGDPVFVAEEWAQRLSLAGVFAYDCQVLDDRKVKRTARYALEDAPDDADDWDTDQ